MRTKGDFAFNERRDSVELPPTRVIELPRRPPLHVAGRCSICDGTLYSVDADARKNCCNEEMCREEFNRRHAHIKPAQRGVKPKYE